jgi:hypothetical protein
MLPNGCDSKRHRIKVGSPRKTVANRAKNFDLLTEHFKVACEPYYFQNENPDTGEITSTAVFSDQIDKEKALLNLVA